MKRWAILLLTLFLVMAARCKATQGLQPKVYISQNPQTATFEAQSQPVTPTPLFQASTTPFPTSATVTPAAILVVSSPPALAEADVTVDYDQVIGFSPAEFGTNVWWTDEDADLWTARYQELHPNLVRLPVLHEFVEPVNDNPNPHEINWDGFLFDESIQWWDRSVTYRRWFEALREADVTVMLTIPYLAGWLSANGDEGIESTFPPADWDEYDEFVKAILVYLTEVVSFPPHRIILEPMSEPDLGCGQDPAVHCLWQHWDFDDLVKVVQIADRAAADIDPHIRVIGLTECCSTELTQKLMDEYDGQKYLDGLSYHRYVYSFDFGDGIARGKRLEKYGLPVYLNEFGNTKYWSNGVEGALWHSAILPQVWAAGTNPVQFPISEWPGMHQGYNQLGLFADWTGDWAVKPAYWVYTNFYNHLGGTELLSNTAPSGMVVLAGRRTDSEMLIVWLTNITLANEEKIIFQIANWPADSAIVTVCDNLIGPEPVAAIRVAAKDDRLTFDYAVPVHSSFSFVLQTIP